MAGLVAVTVSLAATACNDPIAAQTASTTSSSISGTTGPAPSSASPLPEPTGPEPIGVRDVPSAVPRASVRVWYPAVAGTGAGAAPYASAETAVSFGATPDQLRPIRVAAELDAQPAPTATPRPGVALMPGLGSPMALSTALAQDLASNGFVVLTVDPAQPRDGDQPTNNTAGPAERLAQFRSGVSFLGGPDVAALAGPVDPRRLAAGGHSIAGADAAQLSLVGKDIAAIFDLDGWLHGRATTTPVDVPALFVEASGFDDATTAAIARSTHAVTIQLAGATHFDVTDLPCLLAALGAVATSLDLGTIGCTGPATTNALVVRFLRAVLLDGRPTPQASELADGLPGIG